MAAPPSAPALAVSGLTRAYGSHTVVRQLELEVAPGDIYGFLGPNGAGKTTTMRMILGLIRKDAGSVSIFGIEDPVAARAQLGGIVEGPRFYPYLSGVENLRIFSRSEPTVYKPVDLRRGLDITLSLLAHQLRNRITVHKEYRKVPNVECNPSQINQVFMNLLGNAAQAIEGEGDIWLQVKPAGKYVRVRIRDNGCGIAEEHLYRIFEPFFTTKSEAHGTGLGLSITHNIIQDHGGTIEVRSEPGKGTEFTVSLPTTQGSSSQSLSGDTLSETPGSTQQIPIYQRSEHPRVVGMGEVPVEGDTGRYPQENTLDEERSNDTVDFGSQSDELRDPEPGGSFKKTAEMPTFPRGTRPEEDGSDEGDDPE